MLYMASDRLIAPAQLGGLKVTPVNSPKRWMRKQLTKPNIATLTIRGCSCGVGFDDPTDENSHRNRQALGIYLRRVIDNGDSVELFAALSGEEDRPGVEMRTLVPEDLYGSEPSFVEVWRGARLLFTVQTAR